MKIVRVDEQRGLRKEKIKYYLVDDDMIFLEIQGIDTLGNIDELFNNMSFRYKGTLTSYCDMNNWHYEIICEGFNNRVEFMKRHPEYLY